MNVLDITLLKKKNNSNKNIAFRSSDGRPKHIIDIFRDKKSDSFKIYSSNVVKTIIKKNVSPNERFIFTYGRPPIWTTNG